jgi:dihydroflavonol-4-reductase
MLLALAGGKAPAWTGGGGAYVDVRDAALGHLLAATRGRAGEVYIVSGHNLDNRALVHAVARASGRRFAGVPIPLAVARSIVAARERIAVLRGAKPDLARVFFEYGVRRCFYDNTKSVRELGMSYRPFEDTLAHALADFRTRGWL